MSRETINIAGFVFRLTATDNYTYDAGDFTIEVRRSSPQQWRPVAKRKWIAQKRMQGEHLPRFTLESDSPVKPRTRHFGLPDTAIMAALKKWIAKQ